MSVAGIHGAPPPDTTKLAVFYNGGYEVQLLVNATGYAADQKFELFNKQVRYFIGDEAIKGLEVFEIQQYVT